MISTNIFDPLTEMTYCNFSIIHDRVFWIYFIITLFVIVLGMTFIISSNDPYAVTLSIIWLIATVFLMIIVYHASQNWAPLSGGQPVCVVDHNSGCFHPNNRIWLFINILFVLLLIFSGLWAGELGNSDAGPLRTMAGILIILGSIVLYRLTHNSLYSIQFWIAIFYIVIWVGLTIYVTIKS